MSENKVSGVVHLIEDTKTYGQRGFRKRLVVLEQDNGRFVNYIPVDFMNEHCEAVDQIQVGDELEVTFRLAGRKWQKDPNAEVKFFLNAEALNFRILGQRSGAGRSGAGTVQDEAFADTANDDDVPF